MGLDQMVERKIQLCGYCNAEPARLQRLKHPQKKACPACFFSHFEEEVKHTLDAEGLYVRGETIALAVSGGKDSTVLLHVLHTLNERHGLQLDLQMVAVDEGIAGYRDHSLKAVQENAELYGLSLTILSYKELFGLDMDEVVRRKGFKCSCTYCGVFRRRAMDLGAAKVKASRLFTGHNVDDVAETVLLNALKGDAHKLASCSQTVSGRDVGEESLLPFKKCKPLKYCFEKEIVLYAHYKKLVYFSNECTYAKEAFRGPLKELIKGINELRPGLLEHMVSETQHLALKKSQGTKTKINCGVCGEISSNPTCKVCLFKAELQGPTACDQPCKKKVEVNLES